jgi:biopolymer transport protein ExbD
MSDTPRTISSAYPANSISFFRTDTKAVFLQINTDGTVIWNGRKVESDADFRAAMMEVHQHFCGSANAENAHLRADLAQRTAELAKATAERDDARTLFCMNHPLVVSGDNEARDVARRHGWDCFKEVKP